jgi:glutathione S-transferase
MKLFGHDTSPYVRRTRVLLAELGVPFERDPQGWVNASEEMLRHNPLMRVPVLLDPPSASLPAQPDRGDQLLIDSKLIAVYLYDRAVASPPPPPPGRPPIQPTLWRAAHRYDDENVVLAIDGATDSAINVFLLEREGVDKAAVPYLQRQEQRIARCLAWLEGVYAGRTTLGEGALAFADVAIVCALDWMAFRRRYDVTRHPGLCRVMEAHRDRPSFAGTHPSLAVGEALAPPLAPRPRA